ncbi:MAG: hypothetical protein V3U54_13210 [Thermodesulfobacteriota bacterium]
MTQKESDDLFVISEYSSQQATEDGILFDIRTQFKNVNLFNSLITHATMNLLRTHNYWNSEEDSVNVPNLIDLLNNSLHAIKLKTKNLTTEPDHFYNIKVESPNGVKIEVWVCMNEIEENAPHYTIMLPEDY